VRQYLELCEKALSGSIKSNRTGVDTIGYIGDYARYNLLEGFPVVTTKKLPFKKVVGEMLGFLRGYDNASDFRALGCDVWDANANENKQWLESPQRRGTDDLGRIYGVQARDWRYTIIDKGNIISRGADQLANVVNDLGKGIDNRREIVTHWNPGQLSEMALPPCHVLYQFGILEGKLHLSMYQRSCDLPLGVPFNIAGYAWLLSVIAHITKLEVGGFNHFMHDIHIYTNQVYLMHVQLGRTPKPLPRLWIDPRIETLKDLETWVTSEHFELQGYEHDDAINYPFAV